MTASRRRIVSDTIGQGATYGCVVRKRGRGLGLSTFVSWSLNVSGRVSTAMGPWGSANKDLSRPFACNGDERREHFVPFGGLFRSSCGCLAAGVGTMANL